MTDGSAPAVDITVPHSARVWNYWLGGKDHYPVDREFGDRLYALLPEIVQIARQARAFLGRAVTHLAGEVGIRQFLDIGTGLPTADNTHEVAQRVAPDSRIVYVDHDPLVLVHARALLVGTPEGTTTYVHADVREPRKILEAARETLDFTRPIGLIMLGIMGNVADLDEAYAIVRELRDALPSGSYLVFKDGTYAVMGEDRADSIHDLHENENFPYHMRTPEQVARFLDGFDLVEPGLVSTPLWRPAPSAEPPVAIDDLCGVGRKA
ncbi:S-adenosyl methyltransferase [Frankia canadensis]|uniref:S-adenosyl methyltransferase n=1 Tax=Frankia canadensis TaxID=1836972 RepID=A0A2I2KUV5_9ACTN|nr:SAM-dependent methyltransferase [Frankia canadensis]SNQ49446.1 S-adenosyl methyltransferase [Frankia canadensis]SOU56736.1 S-adenosyl methyltransferase [Frankia canadensis]